MNHRGGDCPHNGGGTVPTTAKGLSLKRYPEGVEVIEWNSGGSTYSELSS